MTVVEALGNQLWDFLRMDVQSILSACVCAVVGVCVAPCISSARDEAADGCTSGLFAQRLSGMTSRKLLRWRSPVEAQTRMAEQTLDIAAGGRIARGAERRVPFTRIAHCPKRCVFHSIRWPP